MFFVTYLRRELRRRMRQAIFIALGLAVGIGLVVTVTAASAGVKKAQSDVLSSLYGVGTDVTVTGPAPRRPPRAAAAAEGGQTFQVGPAGQRSARTGSAERGGPEDRPPGSAVHLDQVGEVAAVAKLKDVAAAAGGLALSDTAITIPKNFGAAGGSLPTPNSFNVDGVDTATPRWARSVPGRSPRAARSRAPTRTRTWPWWTPVTRRATS